MQECRFCKEGEIVFQNELFVVYRAKMPECLKNHFVVESTRHILSADELTAREKFWLELTLNSVKNYFIKHFGLAPGSWQLARDFCSPHVHLHLFKPAEFWQPSQNTSLMRERIAELQYRFAGLEAEL
jgi:diadenosine tetraphosphate (Ap4A) HIT family hydrolase